jgi:uncharacterized protein (DUF697 family)/GTP-binding protein EngB required for normal cell division
MAEPCNAKSDLEQDAELGAELDASQSSHSVKSHPEGNDSSQALTDPQSSLGQGFSGLFGNVVGNATNWLGSTFRVDQVASVIVGWFSVSESRLSKILETIRAELPTTEVVLLGKPQSGKSSVIRGLTGTSADIVGLGFRPHTQHTQRYAYPNPELPLLLFTDTVGLGDVAETSQAIAQELITELKTQSAGAKALVLTVKVTDFAIATLQQTAQQLHAACPQIPCLLAVTCLHELYPADVVTHPAYPPHNAEIERAFDEIQAAFAGLCDRAVLIDFTLEEDGYTPTFYGLEAFRDALADLLPEAEARTIHQLLDTVASKKLGDLYRDVGRRSILPFALIAATVAAVPLPFATMPVLTALQVSMVGVVGKVYHQTLSPSQAGGVVSAIAGGFLAQAIGRELIKFIPGFGSVIAASWAAAYTWALGEAACVYFGDVMGGKKPDPERIQQVMKDSFETAKQRFKEIKIKP